MVIDFQQHYTPPELIKERGAVSVRLDENGNPNYLLNPLLADLEAHILSMPACCPAGPACRESARAIA